MTKSTLQINLSILFVFTIQCRPMVPVLRNLFNTHYSMFYNRRPIEGLKQDYAIFYYQQAKAE